jgi:oligo-1,6-glucosidase
MPEHPWWAAAVVYQVYPRSFQDSDGDGIGDLRGLIDRLDHLAWLGIDVIWLSPVFRSPGFDNGYDVSDYRAIDPVFGTLADMDELIGAVHHRGMRLVLDLVLNHTSHEHPWFRESRASRTSPKRDWYWWRAPGPDGALPTNWGGFFGGPAWTLDEATGEAYLHLFTPQQPDLNWETPAVREAIGDLLRWWLDRGVDGFRLDVINLVSKDPALPDGPAGGSGLGDGSASYVSGPRIHEYLRELHDALRAARPGRPERPDHPLTIGEMVDLTVDQARLFTDPDRRELDLVFQFHHMGLDRGAHKFDIRPLHLPDLKRLMAEWQAGLAEHGGSSLFLGNHDQPRAVSRFGDDRRFRRESATLLAAVMYLQRGTPFLLQGEEIGMTNTRFDGIDDFRDVESLNHYAAEVAAGADPARVLDGLREGSRDNARTPMQWTGGPGAGFSAGPPWIPVNPNAATINVEAARQDPESVLHFYRRLIALRREEPVFALGSFELLLPDDQRVYAYTRRLDEVEALVVGNWSGEPAAVDLEDWMRGRLVLANDPAAGGRGDPVLGPWEVRVLVRDAG